jgi:hypothetical protein
VGGVTLVDKSPGRAYRSTHSRIGGFNRRLEVPYQVVELLVPVRGGRDTVLAVDAVDSGSVNGLAHGARLPVRLDPASPRDAQLAGGTRRFLEANRYHFLIPVLGCGILGTFAGLGYRWRRRKQETRAREETMARQGTAIATGALLLLLGTMRYPAVTPPVAAREHRVHRMDALSEARLTAAPTAMIGQSQTASMEVWGHAPHSA